MVMKNTARSTQQNEYAWEYDQEELYVSLSFQAEVRIFAGEPRIMIQSDSELYVESTEDSNVFSLVVAEHVQANKAVVEISIPKDQVSRLWLRLGYGSIHIDNTCIGELHVEGGNTSVCVGSECCIPKFSMKAKHGSCTFADAMQSRVCVVKIDHGSVLVPLEKFQCSRELSVGLGHVTYDDQQVRVADFSICESKEKSGMLRVALSVGSLTLV